MWIMTLDKVLKVVSIIGESVPAAIDLLEAAASGFRSMGREEDAKRVEAVLPERSRSRAVQEALEASDTEPPTG
jgi:hypothetical protein